MTADIHTLAGAYAIDALDPTERRDFERHLAVCQACRDEVRELRATAALLGSAVAENPPADLKSAVMAEIDRTRQLGPMVVPVDELGWRGFLQRLAVPVAAVLIMAVVGLGLLVRDLYSRIDQVERGSSEIVAVLASPDARFVEVRDPQGVAGRLVYSPSTGRAVLLAHGLGPVPEDRTYQLWVIGEQGPTPAGIFRPTGEVAAALVHGDVRAGHAIGVTIEPAGGSPQPTGDVLLLVEYADSI